MKIFLALGIIISLLNTSNLLAFKKVKNGNMKNKNGRLAYAMQKKANADRMKMEDENVKKERIRYER